LPAFFTSIKTTNRNGSPGADGGYRATAFGSDCVTLFPQMIALHGQAGELAFVVGRSVGRLNSGGTKRTAGQVAKRLKSEWFGVVGLTLSCEPRLVALTASIEAVRRPSFNGSVLVMVVGASWRSRNWWRKLLAATGRCADCSSSGTKASQSVMQATASTAKMLECGPKIRAIVPASQHLTYLSA
jgi:hypothetical protein